MPDALHVHNAKKNFGSLAALKGIELQVKKGEFFGLLGPNGAGKTTLISAIVGLCKLSEGSIDVYGHDTQKEPLKAKAFVGFSPQEVNLDRFFPIRKILMYQAGFYGLSFKEQKNRTEELLSQFELSDKADQPYYKLSGGMQKRLLIAKAVITQPKVLILDEPTAGVDVAQRHRLWQYLKNLNKDGTSIILTTHYIDEAEELCERIGIIHLGEIREIGSPHTLIEKYCVKTIRVTLSKPINQNTTLENKDYKITVCGSHIETSGHNVALMMSKINEILAQNPDSQLSDLSVERGTLEDVFLKVTGTRMGEADQ
ncbi:MAG: hypothetical protein ACD_73C00575G0004 [uncultured bacterium]|nr:MAG: hypothetical protein ACD_73C00575G0004 [uncultured bacterium]